MGNTVSSARDLKLVYERVLSDHKRKLKRLLSKSNSMEALNKEEIKDISSTIRQVEVVLEIMRAREDEHAPSF